MTHVAETIMVNDDHDSLGGIQMRTTLIVAGCILLSGCGGTYVSRPRDGYVSRDPYPAQQRTYADLQSRVYALEGQVRNLNWRLCMVEIKLASVNFKYMNNGVIMERAYGGRRPEC